MENNDEEEKEGRRNSSLGKPSSPHLHYAHITLFFSSSVRSICKPSGSVRPSGTERRRRLVYLELGREIAKQQQANNWFVRVTVCDFINYSRTGILLQIGSSLFLYTRRSEHIEYTSDWQSLGGIKESATDAMSATVTVEDDDEVE